RGSPLHAPRRQRHCREMAFSMHPANLLCSLRLARRGRDTTIRTADGHEAPVAAALKWTATVLHSPVAGLVGRRFAIEGEVRLGRTDVDVAIEDGKLSRLHATLVSTGGGVAIRDEGSSNGTHVNGRRVKAATLAAGDIVRVGDSLLAIDDAPPGRPSEDE